MQELLEVGATCLLMDEDTCATNFMMRDVRMAALVSADKEPITPFVQQIRCVCVVCTRRQRGNHYASHPGPHPAHMQKDARNGCDGCPTLPLLPRAAPPAPAADTRLCGQTAMLEQPPKVT